MAIANHALKKGNLPRLKLFLILTILLGATFLGGQMLEYSHLFAQEVTIDKDIFGSAFFTLTGFHGFHVFVGLIILSILSVFAFKGMLPKNEDSSFFLAAEWYWHFVDVVWVFVFFIVYLMPVL